MNISIKRPPFVAHTLLLQEEVLVGCVLLEASSREEAELDGVLWEWRRLCVSGVEDVSVSTTSGN
jgi:hypothetical protein